MVPEKDKDPVPGKGQEEDKVPGRGMKDTALKACNLEVCNMLKQWRHMWNIRSSNGS